MEKNKQWFYSDDQEKLENISAQKVRSSAKDLKKNEVLIQGEQEDYPMVAQVYSRNKGGNETRSNKLYQTTTTMRLSTYDNSSKQGNFRGRSSFLQTQYTGDERRNH